MSGAEIQRLRLKLGLDHVIFAKFLCVHPSAVHRWEMQADPSPNGYTPEILAKLAAVRPTVQLGDLLRRAVNKHGALAGMSVLLKWEQGYRADDSYKGMS